MFKKILSITLSLSLLSGVSYSSAFASLPPNHPMFIFMDGTDPENRRLIERIPEAVEFINRYSNEVDTPLDNLLRQITRTHTLNFQNDTGLYHAVALTDNTQFLNLASRFKNFLDNEINPLATYVMLLLSAIQDFRSFTNYFTPTSDSLIMQLDDLLDQLPARINDLIRMVDQIHAFSRESDQIEPQKPTPDDFEKGNCVDTNLMG